MIAEDIKVKSPLWGSPNLDEQSQLWTDQIVALNLVVKNEEATLTIERGRVDHISI